MYPRNVYIVPGPFRLPGGGSYGLESVKDKVAHDAALKSGFFDSVPEAIEAGEAKAEEVKPKRGRLPKED